MGLRDDPVANESRIHGPVRSWAGTVPERRRTERVLIQVHIFVQGVTSDGHAFREDAKTLVVSAHGALIRLAQDIRPEATITLTNAVTNEQQTCRIAYVKPTSGNIRTVGVEFLKPAPKFWRIDFPPADW